MDGNGRWAAQRGQPRVAGHRAGVEAVRAAVDTSARLGLDALTLYAFSTENWKRPRLEVDALMRMLKRYLRLELEEIDRQRIRFQAIGRTEALAEIPTNGKFDPHVHEALLSQPSEAEEGTVIEVLQKGYRLGDRVLRPARVVVAAAQEGSGGDAS